MGDYKAFNSEGKVITGVVTNASVSARQSDSGAMGDWDTIDIKVGDKSFFEYEIADNENVDKNGQATENVNTTLYHRMLRVFGFPEDGKLYLFENVPYVGESGAEGKAFRKIYAPGSDAKEAEEVRKALYEQLNKYETGGLADFTGPAWLDGTKSSPELVLNAVDTKNFI
jgi:hypothetical protein